MPRFTEAKNTSYVPGSQVRATAENLGVTQRQISSTIRHKDLLAQNNLVFKEITNRLKDKLAEENHPPINLTVCKKNPDPKENKENPELLITIIPIKVTDSSITYISSDQPETPQTAKPRNFLIETKLAIRGPGDVFQPNPKITI